MKPLLLAALLALAAPAAREAGVAAPPATDPLGVPVTFLSEPPVVDGLLDASLAALPVRRLPVVRGDATGSASGAPPTFRLGYGTGFLWVFVEAEGEALAYRDRAFQNGDGFYLVLALPRPDGAPSNEFSVVAVSAVDRPAMEWTRRVVWYRGPDKVFVPLGPQAKAATAVRDGRIGLELLLPWSDIPPFHPWVSPAIGFNLAFVKAVGEREKTVHLLLDDPSIDSERKPRRSQPLVFERPRLAHGAASFVAPKKGHVRAGEPLEATAVTVASQGTADSISVRVRTAEGTLVASARADVTCTSGSCATSLLVDAGTLLPGGYRLEWASREGATAGETPVSVLPAVDERAIDDRLAKLPEGRVAEGSKTTIRFLAREAAGGLAALPGWETAGRERLALEEAADLLARAEAGDDLLARRTGAFRRAFRSRRDGTLQPYAVRIPPGLARGTKLPLLVWLHGSGSDETALFSAPPYSGGAAVEIAPRARGTSHAYATDEAVADVFEAIDDALATTPADPDRVVLCGFSMGGYGAYRLFLERPARFRGVAVFSGHPDLANRWTGTTSHPSVLDAATAARFRGVPVFVFHGRRDRNTPFELTERTVERLKAAGAAVDFAVEDEAGHEAPGPATLETFRKWLARVAAPRR